MKLDVMCSHCRKKFVVDLNREIEGRGCNTLRIDGKLWQGYHCPTCLHFLWIHRRREE